jgi:hypothetical protein
MLAVINARQDELAAEVATEEQQRIREWEQSRAEGPGTTPGSTIPVTPEEDEAWTELAERGVPEDICDFVPDFVVKDSGVREEFDSGMVRDTEDGKPDFTLIRKGPMFRRWAEHLTKGAIKYGRHNWTNACSEEEYERFQRSAARHFEQWLNGERDEDHAAAVMFNLNAAEYVRDRAL